MQIKRIRLLIIFVGFVTSIYGLSPLDDPKVYAQTFKTINLAHEPDSVYDKVYGHGIDLSHYNDEPDWKQLDVDFVIMKASEGISYVDPTFKSRAANARKHNIPVGAYHYFKGVENGRKEFENYFKTVGHNIDIIPVIDTEKVPKDRTKDEFQNNFKLFLGAAMETYGRLPIIYAHEKFYLTTIKPVIENHYADRQVLLWFGDKDYNYSDFIFTPHIHQAEIKNIKGVKGKVDYNVLHTPFEHLLLKSK